MDHGSIGHSELAYEGELSLIHQAAHGDHEAFRSLVISYEARLLTYLTQMLGDPDNARDIAQETFVAIFHALPRWQPPSITPEDHDIAHPLAPWLYRIATNRALSLLRKQAVRLRVHSHHFATALRQGQGEVIIQESFEDRYIAHELLREALRHLSEEDAACLVMHFVSGERYAEIAARLGLTSEAVRKRVARALVALRKAYHDLDTEVRS